MFYREFRQLVNEAPLSDSDVVMFINTDAVQMFSVKDVVPETVQYDEEGNVISTGGTLFIKGEPH